LREDAATVRGGQPDEKMRPRMDGFTFPPPLAPGARIHVVAPSSPFPEVEFFRGLAWLRDRYAIVLRQAVLSRKGYLAGDDGTRLRPIAEAMEDPDARAIVVARGGYGATRLADRLPWETFARDPKWFVGFSDVTALHAEATARRIASVHAPNVTGLGAALPWTRGAWLRALERPRAPVTWRDLRVVRGGRAEGVLVGGNLALVHAMAAAGRWDPPPGAILAVEDVTEKPYRIDRMLTSLRVGGHMARLSAIVFGDFAQCDPGPDGVTAEEVLVERTADLGIPILLGAPFGHGARNDAFALGARARVGGSVVVVG
jgi:muramoyltetrapeptide carboxypeptidase